MRHDKLHPAERASVAAILAFHAEMASATLRRLLPGDAAIGAAFDRTYGPGNWFLSWDEDLTGKPIRGTIMIGSGGDRLVLG